MTAHHNGFLSEAPLEGKPHSGVKAGTGRKEQLQLKVNKLLLRFRLISENC